MAFKKVVGILEIIFGGLIFILNAFPLTIPPATAWCIVLISIGFILQGILNLK